MLGRQLLLFSETDPLAASLTRATAPWGCMSTPCSSLDQLRAQLEAGRYDLVLVEPAAALRRLLPPPVEEEQQQMTLAEVEKRHILRVLAANDGNKSRAARVLGVDAKTLYNKLNRYRDEAERRRRQAEAAARGGPRPSAPGSQQGARI
jgi:transcriptional regulator with GAF, ATPase, and Fis domain